MGVKFFTGLDLQSGYWQIHLANDVKEKTAFTCQYSHFQFHIMPFGLTNAPATFQRMMNNILHDYIDRTAMAYLDDMSIFSKSEEDHIEPILEIARELQKHSLILNEKKCTWVLRYCRNVHPTWVKFDSKDTKESDVVFEVLSTKSKKRT